MIRVIRAIRVQKQIHDNYMLKKDEHDCNATLYTFRLENLTDFTNILYLQELLRHRDFLFV